MKPFLALAALLMTAASIYGVVDYSRTTKDQRFQTLYTPVEHKPVDTRALATRAATALAAAQNEEKELTAFTQEEPEAPEKPAAPKKLTAKMYSRAALETMDPPPVKKER